MTTPDITVVIPTVNGREALLEQCIGAYYRNTTATLEILTFKDLSGVAFGWQRGAEKARGRFLHLTADDITPRPGWDEAAMGYAQMGQQPSPLLFNTDGSAWVSGAPCSDPEALTEGHPVGLGSLPFLDREWWPHITPLPPGMHYYSDNWITHWLADMGVPTVFARGYAFDHSWAHEHRGAGWPPNERQFVDRDYFDMAVDIVTRGRAALR